MIMFYLLSGKMEQDDNGLWTVYVNGQWSYYLCEGELMYWVETGELKYDDNLCYPGELEFYTAGEEE